MFGRRRASSDPNRPILLDIGPSAHRNRPKLYPSADSRESVEQLRSLRRVARLAEEFIQVRFLHFTESRLTRGSPPPGITTPRGRHCWTASASFVNICQIVPKSLSSSWWLLFDMFPGSSLDSVTSHSSSVLLCDLVRCAPPGLSS